MYCQKCGAQLEPNSKFCSNCGSAVTSRSQNYDDIFDPPQATSYNAPTFNQQQSAPNTNARQEPEETNIYAILGFVLSFIFPIVGLVLSIIGRGKQQYRALATAGMVISIVSLVLGLIVGIVMISVLNDAVSFSTNYLYH